MMPSSCSFRITRTTEDLALTMSALSERLVKLEQKMESFEKKLIKNVDPTPSSKEIEILDGVDKLLKDCHKLLDTTSSNFQSETGLEDDLPQDSVAA